MYVLGYLLQGVAGVLHILLSAATVVVIARAVLSWVSPDPFNPLVRIINQLSEPMIYPVRSRLPYLGGIDFSPMVVLLVIYFLNVFLVQTLQRIALSLIYG
ncbi:MAG: YggT family protein [Zetaproteobacteria bacterium]|nr:MAG: YggT family protein [Zetaproteobacteria bacterium]